MKKLTGQMLEDAINSAAHDHYSKLESYELVAYYLNAELDRQHNAAADRTLWRAFAAAGVLDLIGLTLLLMNNQVGWAAFFGGLFAILLFFAWRRA